MAEQIGGMANILNYTDFSASHPSVAKAGRAGGGASGDGFDTRLKDILGPSPTDIQAVSSDFDKAYMQSWLGLMNYAKSLRRKNIDVTQGVDPRNPYSAEAVAEFNDALALHMSNRERLKRGKELQDKFYQGMTTGQLREGSMLPGGIVTDDSYAGALVQALPKAIDEYTQTLAAYKPKTEDQYNESMAHYNEIVDSIREVGEVNGLAPDVIQERIAMLPKPMMPGETEADKLDLELKRQQIENAKATRANIWDQIKKRKDATKSTYGGGGDDEDPMFLLREAKALADLLSRSNEEWVPGSDLPAVDRFGAKDAYTGDITEDIANDLFMDVEYNNVPFNRLIKSGGNNYFLMFRDDPDLMEDGDQSGMVNEKTVRFTGSNILPVLLMKYTPSQKRSIKDKLVKLGVVDEKGMLSVEKALSLDLDGATGGTAKSATSKSESSSKKNIGFSSGSSSSSSKVNLGFK